MVQLGINLFFTGDRLLHERHLDPVVHPTNHLTLFPRKKEFHGFSPELGSLKYDQGPSGEPPLLDMA